MTESDYNPNDPEFLASCALDEPLSGEAKAKHDEALDASSDVRSLGEQLGAIDRLVKRWGRRQPNIDWKDYTRLVKARVESIGEEDQLDAVDSLMSKWASSHPIIDERRFESAVMDRIGRYGSANVRRRIIFRIGASLAAAAAIAIVATGFYRSNPSDQRFVQVAIGPPGRVASTYGPSSAFAVVSFDRTPPIRKITGRQSSLSFLAMGSSPLGGLMEESPPL